MTGPRFVNTAAPNQITQLLVDLSDGKARGARRPSSIVYGELRRAARRSLQRERPNQTLSANALVNEVYLQLVGQADVQWQNRAHFFGIAANLMRQILVQHARRHQTAKRGGGQDPLALDEELVPPRAPSIWWHSTRRSATWPSATRGKADRRTAVLWRAFAEETAEVLGISPRTSSASGACQGVAPP